MYIPKWVVFDHAVSHVWAVQFQGGYREDARQLLIKAIRDGDIRARDARTDEPFPWSMWAAASVNPVHLPTFALVEVCTTDLLRCWPEQSKKTELRKRPRPTDQELDEWMHRTVKRGAKRDYTIADCRRVTGATCRAAAEAWGRLPNELKLKRGQREAPPKIEQ